MKLVIGIGIFMFVSVLIGFIHRRGSLSDAQFKFLFTSWGALASWGFSLFLGASYDNFLLWVMTFIPGALLGLQTARVGIRIRHLENAASVQE